MQILHRGIQHGLFIGHRRQRYAPAITDAVVGKRAVVAIIFQIINQRLYRQRLCSNRVLITLVPTEQIAGPGPEVIQPVHHLHRQCHQYGEQQQHDNQRGTLLPMLHCHMLVTVRK